MAYRRPGYPAIPDDIIDITLKHLREKDPEATWEDAIEVLKRQQEVIREWNLTNPEGLIKFHKKLKREKRMKTN